MSRTHSLTIVSGNLHVAMVSPVGFDDDGSVDDCTSGMLVAVRLRPLSNNEKLQGHRSCCRVVGDQVVVIEKFGVPNGHLKSQQSSSKEYAFDIAFPDDATQEEVYSKTVKDIVPTILNGYHATIFAYGATGAGKTHTMMGSERDGLSELEDFDDEDFQVDGIIPHALSDIFAIIRHRKEEEAMLNLSHGSTFEWKVLVSYLEVYNEQIRDLLQPSSRPLALREDPARGIVHVAGLHYEEAQSVSHVLQLLRRGNRHRKTEPTAANQVSSRSHAVIQVTVRHTTTTMLSEMHPRKSTIEGKLSLIDLAGSERASTTQNRGMRLTEGANINKSLLALANCINSLSSNNRKRSASFDSSQTARRQSSVRANLPKVQYRDSKLTHLLKNSLEGECRLVMIANVNPSHSCFDESHNTLKYANRAKNIKIRPKMHVMTAEMTYQQRLEKLEKENIQLRQALAQAQADIGVNDSGFSKRKSVQLDHEVSPETLKRFKNLAWGDSASRVNASRQENDEDVDAMRGTIRSLHEEITSLRSQVSTLQLENETFKFRLKQADKILEPLTEAMMCDGPESYEPEPSPAQSSAPSILLGPPKRIRSGSQRHSMIPRPANFGNQENVGAASNLAPPTIRTGGAARRKSFFVPSGTHFQPTLATPAGSRLKHPKEYRKSIGGRA